MTASAFDELLGFEEQAQKLELEIGKGKDFLRQCQKKIQDGKAQIQIIEKNLKILTEHKQEMKKRGVVVLLSEYENTIRLVEENKTMLEDMKLAVAKARKLEQETAELIPVLTAQLRNVNKEMSKYNKVLEIRR